jgi:ribosomal-protein-alanine N-acetyltransferase
MAIARTELIRAGKISDAPLVFAIDKGAFSGPSLPQFFFVDAPGIFGDAYLVAELAGEVAGYAIGYVDRGTDPAGHIFSIGVSPSARGRGLATKLLMECVAKLTHSGVTRVVLVVSPQNTSARQLYKKVGFREFAHHENWFGPGEHRLRMELQC